MTQEEFSNFRKLDGEAGCLDVNLRLENLKSFKNAIHQNHDGLVEALTIDLGKPLAEIYGSEIGFVLRDIDHACRKLKRWAKPVKVKVPKIQQPGNAHYKYYPLGTVLIIGAWNYPIQLTFSPLVGALAAGNKVVLKPSEHAPKTASIISKICDDAFHGNPVIVKEGGIQTAETLINYPFDFIFFTGSNKIGKIVAQAASSNMVPCVLELGGKSPCIVHSDADVKIAAKRIMWGKYVNAGQTCIAPDYVMVHNSVKSRFLGCLAENYKKFFGDIDAANGAEGEYCKIIHAAHFDRLEFMLSDVNVAIGGEKNREQRLMTTAILTGCHQEDPVMEEEIFGPLLPVLGYDEFDEVHQTISKLPNPLAAYIFTKNENIAEQFQDKIRAGSMCVNDVLGQATPADLPFGGVGDSGYGRYHGKMGFQTFSYSKSVFKKNSSFDLPMKFPPYRKLPDNVSKIFSWFLK